MKEIQERVGGGGGPVTVEGDTFRQNTFSNICLYMDSAHKTTQGIFNFHFCLFVKWANIQVQVQLHVQISWPLGNRPGE